MPVQVQYPDYMPDVRYWLRTDPTLQPLHGGRVFFRLPDTVPGVPMLRVSQVGGGALGDQEAAIMQVNLVVEIWGMQGQDYQAVRQTSIALQWVCNQWSARNLLNPASNTRMLDVMFNNAFDSPDPETGWPRIICHLTAILTAVTPTVLGQ